MSAKLSNSPETSTGRRRDHAPLSQTPSAAGDAAPNRRVAKDCLRWAAVQNSEFSGDRSATRSTLELKAARWPGVDFSIATEDISSLTDWKMLDNRHSVVVHLNGPIDKLETELEGCGAVVEAPMAGEVWIIPAGQRYFSQARGKVVRFAEFYLDPRFLAEFLGKHVQTKPIRPLAGHSDEFLYRCVQHLAVLVEKPDDLSRMTAQTLSQTLFLHFFSEYGLHSGCCLTGRLAVELLPKDVQLLREHVQACLDERISLDDLATLVHMTTHDFLLAFRKSFGTTPAQYVIEERMRRARWLLSDTKKDIATIALKQALRVTVISLLPSKLAQA